KLQKTDIAKGIDNRLWVLTSREKTETSSNIPLLPQALEIVGRYAYYPPCVAKGLVLPVLSYQKMNSYLKEIADLCGITKKLTFHMARHTFATTVTLANNVPIETVSKCWDIPISKLPSTMPSCWTRGLAAIWRPYRSGWPECDW